MNISNLTSEHCNLTINPWCGQFGALQVVEITVLSIITFLGVFGNLLVISSICFEKKFHKHGNAFIINLAIADFVATGIFTPTLIANVAKGGRAIPLTICEGFGFLIVVACSTSMWNLGFIALNRYWAVVRNKSYSKAFSKRKVYVMMAFAWIWSVIVAIPTLTGWSGLLYDYKSMVCSWDDVKSREYNVVLMMSAVVVPLSCTIFCYWKLFWHVREKSRKLSMPASRRKSMHDSDLRKKHLQREISLLKTLFTTVIIFVICWTPYCGCVLFNPVNVSPEAKKVCTWLGLCNSAVNFIIYGAMNRGFRKGYKHLLAFVFCCTRDSSVSTHQSSSYDPSPAKRSLYTTTR